MPKTIAELIDEGPRLYFKYQSVNKYTLQNLANNYLWLSKLSDFNDPFEGSYRFKGNKIPSKDQQERIDTVSNFGVICLAVSPELSKNPHIIDTQIHPNNMLMWSHYSNSHFGFCLGLRNKFLTYKVNYTIAFPSIDLSKSLSSIEVQMFSALHTKNPCWSYENEYRILNTNANNTPFNYQHYFDLERIYFGLRTPKGEIDLIKKITQGQNIKYFKTRLESNKFQMTFEEI